MTRTRTSSGSKNAVLASILLLGFVTVAVEAADDLPVYSESILVVDTPVYMVEVPPAKAFEVAFRVGELDIESRPVTRATLELQADCRKLDPDVCRRKLSRVRLHTTELEDRVRVELRGLSRRAMRKLDVEGTIVVPERAPLFVKMGIGDLDIESGPQDLHVAMGIGDLSVHAPRQAVGGVEIKTGIGDASLHGVPARTQRRRLVGAKVGWQDGAGDAHIQLRLKIGDASVRLRP